jgi:hypothetical protein
MEIIMFIENKYTKWYYSIIAAAKSRVLPPDIYTERHHIIPDCFYKNSRNKSGWLDGNPNEESNLVILTAHEHFVCHLLLPKMTIGRAKYKMINALLRTSVGFNYNGRYNITGRTYSTIKKDYSLMRSGQVGWCKGKSLANYITKAGKVYEPWNKGKTTPQKGMTYEEIHGTEKAASLRSLRSSSLKGKAKSEATRKLWSQNRKGKTNGGLNSNATPVTINGIDYACKKDACTALNITPYELSKML